MLYSTLFLPLIRVMKKREKFPELPIHSSIIILRGNSELMS